MMIIICFGILTGIALVLLICEIISASVPLTIVTITLWAIVIFAWSFIAYHYINLKRKRIFFEKIEKVLSLFKNDITNFFTSIFTCFSEEEHPKID